MGYHWCCDEGVGLGTMKSRSGMKGAFTYCMEQVRRYDYHHYMCLLELPSPPTRMSAFAIRAFNVEIARAMDVASDPNIGLMRLVWWRDALDKIYSLKPVDDHPTAQALSHAVRSANITKAWLTRSVNARIDDANAEFHIPSKLQDLERYAEDTASTALYATLQAGGINSTAADHAASHIGKAGALLLLIRSIPYHASRNRHHRYIPLEVAEKHGLIVQRSGQPEVSLEPREKLCDAVFEMASLAGDHLRTARSLAGTVPAEARPVLLPAVAAQVALDSLRKVNFDVFDPKLSRGILGSPPLWFQMKLKWHSLRGKY